MNKKHIIAFVLACGMATGCTTKNARMAEESERCDRAAIRENTVVLDITTHIIEQMPLSQLIKDVKLTDGETIVGTGCHFENQITGVYVLPEYQGHGYGTMIMDHLEAKIFENYDAVLLDASLAAVFLYEHRGYKTVGHGKYELENGVKLVYEIMEKKLADNRTKI